MLSYIYIITEMTRISGENNVNCPIFARFDDYTVYFYSYPFSAAPFAVINLL